MAKLTLKAARVNVALTQKEAALALKISNNTLCNWEKGVSYPDYPMIEKICELYSVPFDDLIFLPENPLKEDYGNEGAH